MCRVHCRLKASCCRSTSVSSKMNEAQEVYPWPVLLQYMLAIVSVVVFHPELIKMRAWIRIKVKNLVLIPRFMDGVDAWEVKCYVRMVNCWLLSFLSAFSRSLSGSCVFAIANMPGIFSSHTPRTRCQATVNRLDRFPSVHFYFFPHSVLLFMVIGHHSPLLDTVKSVFPLGLVGP